MRSFVIACAALSAAACISGLDSASAQDWLRDAVPLESRTHDFGTVARAAKTEHRFEIKNVTASPLHLRSVRASCGCTTPIIETETIAPGETGTILARFNTGTFTGRRSATLTVTIDKPNYTELQLNVRGYIRSDVVLNPGEVNFGEIPLGESKSIDVTLDYAGRSDWQITSIDSPLDFVDVKFEELSRNAGRIKYALHASLNEEAPIGFMQNQFLLRTNDRNLTSVPIHFNANVLSPVQVSPTTLALGSVIAEEPTRQRLVVKARQPFRITEMRCEQADIAFTPAEEPKEAYLMNLTITPKGNEADGEVKGEILVFTDLVEQPVRIGLSFNIEAKSPPSSVVQAR